MKLSIPLLIIGLYACGHQTEVKKHIPDTNAKQFNDSAINIAIQTQNFEKAISLLDSATQIDSNYFEAYNNKLSFQFNLDRFIDALATAKNLIRISPGNPSSYFLTGILLDKTGDSTNAQKYYTEVVKRIDSFLYNTNRADKKYDDALMTKGITFILLGQPEKGNEILKQVSEKQKDEVQKEIYGHYKNKSRKEILDSFTSVDSTTDIKVSNPKIQN